MPIEKIESDVILLKYDEIKAILKTTVEENENSYNKSE